MVEMIFLTSLGINALFIALTILVQFIVLAPIAYVSILGFVVIALVVVGISHRKEPHVVLTVCTIISLIFLAPVIAHYIQQPLTKECSASRDVVDISVDEKGSHYVMGIWASKGTGHIGHYEFDADHLMPVNTSRDIEFRLLGVVDNHTGYFSRFTTWVLDDRKVIVSVIQGQQKDTIEMSSENYKDAIEIMRKSLKDDGSPVSGKSDTEWAKSNFRQDVERAKNI